MKSIYLVLFIIIFSTCAKIGSPTGGPEDDKAPELLNSIPEKNTINFSSNKIELNFDEYISVNNTQNLIISPYVEKKPEVTAKGKKVIIQFKEPLEINTTYSIYLNNMISDITKGNVLNDFHFAFSTGNILDSLSINGNIKNVYDNENLQNITVALYTEKLDTHLLKSLPKYFGKTNAQGNYEIKNLKEGKYHLIAFKDENLNNLSDKNELFAFSDTLLELSSLNISFDTKVSYMRNKEGDILADCQNFGINKHVFKINDVNEFLKLDFQKKITGTNLDSLIIYSAKNDSIKNICDSIVSHEIIIDKNFEIKNIQPKDTLKFYFDKNLSFNKKHISIIEDTNAIDTQNFYVEKNKIFYKWKREKSYDIKLDSGAVQYLDNSNINQVINFKLSPINKLGNMNLKITNEKLQNLIYEIWNTNDKICIEKGNFNTAEKAIKLENILPGTYQIKVINDKNNNGVFDNGNFISGEISEKIFLSQKIELRANWELNDLVISPVFN